jgi:hypothetical protein
MQIGLGEKKKDNGCSTQSGSQAMLYGNLKEFSLSLATIQHS